MKQRKSAWLWRVLFILSAALFIWLFLPIFSGVFNLFNVLGMAACLLLMLVSCLHRRLAVLLKKLWSKTAWRIILVTLSALVSAGLLLFAIVLGLVISGMFRSATGCNTIIVLGCQVRGETPSRLLRYRIDSAYAYLTENPDAVCIVSGGKGSDESISEAECMFRELSKRGIDASRIYKEDQSTNTIENMRNSLAIIERENLPEKVAIITNNFHMYRAQHIAAKLGLKTQGISAKTDVPLLAVYLLRESVAMVYYLLFGVKTEW